MKQPRSLVLESLRAFYEVLKVIFLRSYDHLQTLFIIVITPEKFVKSYTWLKQFKRAQI